MEIFDNVRNSVHDPARRATESVSHFAQKIFFGGAFESGFALRARNGQGAFGRMQKRKDDSAFAFRNSRHAFIMMRANSFSNTRVEIERARQFGGRQGMIESVAVG